MAPKLTPRLTLMLSLPPLLWAGNSVLGRSLVPIISPLLLNSLRWALALLLLAPFARTLWAAPEALLRRWRYYALLGFLGMGCYNALQYQALHTSTAVNTSLIAASLPVWTLVLGTLLYRNRPTTSQALGALLSLIGVAFVVGRGDWKVLTQVHFVPGDLLMLLAVFCWAIYSWLLARPPGGDREERWDWAGLLMAQILYGVLFAGGMAGLETWSGHATLHLGPRLAWALAYVAICPSLIAYRCWGLGVNQAGPALAAFFNNLTPVFAALLSALLLGEWPAWYHWLAFGLIALGIGVSSRSPGPRLRQDRAASTGRG